MSEKPAHMRYEHLVQMANDISHFFQSETDHDVAISAVAKHIRSFWVPRMRQHIIAHVHAGGEGMSTLAREAVLRLEMDAAKENV